MNKYYEKGKMREEENERRGVAPYPPLQLLPIVSLAESFNIGPNVAPLSVLVLRSGSLLVAFLSHHVTITLLSLSPNVSICASCESALVELLRLILSPKVLPPSVDALNITSSFPVLLVHHAM
jgi:hypothetical protein